ncbi:hypothetical protein BDF20DRAFT_845902 [Mycotypha africana]|uniref:uncharacterized protein n=1 Tax=Mycotypha africana TaxID=64632 RepID=UPI0023005FBC|nr:uncharacterized protein BDF20DRAFT_845902 [Mycotypha africana]KAI8991700.1 hypothetical protein BDF20DRAFT_845902 [Mycotypha africana]
MSHLGMSKPNLPSIHFLLQEADETATTISPDANTCNIVDDNSIAPQPSNSKRRYGHRVSRSVSSLPVDLQALSLQGPEDRIEQQSVEAVHQSFLQQSKQQPAFQQIQTEPYNGIPSNSAEKPPSWMLPNDRPPAIMMNYTSSSSPAPTSISSLSSTSVATAHTRRKAPYTGHGRSVSEITLPPISSALSQPFPQPLPYPTTLGTPSRPASATSILPANNTSITTTTNNNNNFTQRTAANSSHKQTQTHHTHRRAISANTLDFMLSPSSHSYSRAQSYSPQEQSLNLISQYRQHPPSSNFFEQLGTGADRTIINHNAGNNNGTANTSSIEPSSSAAAGRYACPYCQKKFSRPSSLRIHTYSHTGEKPFVCTEPGCGRHFSVQSNMRRHLRVHRLGRNNNVSSGSSNNGNTTGSTPTVLEEDIDTE